ncbi:exported hypothetical protein [Frankia sp. Hr75.2]|nr:exported hypothetical protein [Frankia sp. Hr75.2]
MTLTLRKCSAIYLLLLVAIFLAVAPFVAQPASAVACPEPNVSLSRSQGPTGTEVRISGYGWSPDSKVYIQIPHGSGAMFYINTATPSVAPGGNWATQMTVGQETPPGEYMMMFDQKAEGCVLHETGTFTVW